MNFRSVTVIFFAAFLTSSCALLELFGIGGDNAEPEDAALGIVNKVDSLTANVITICGASYSVSSEKVTEVSIGVKDVLKSPVQGDAKLALNREKVAGWKASNPDSALYYDCVEKQTVHAINKLEAENAKLKEELWISNVAVIDMNSYFRDWKRSIDLEERWKQYDVDKVENILKELKKNKLIS